MLQYTHRHRYVCVCDPSRAYKSNFDFFDFQDQDGLDDEDSYPYEAVDYEPCRYTKSHRAADDSGFKMLPEGNEHALKHALAKQGPVSVAIDASNVSFQFYKQGKKLEIFEKVLNLPKGVYFEPACSPANLDHGVLAVGYGEENGEKVNSHCVCFFY